jgi:hypothetical protein
MFAEHPEVSPMYCSARTRFLWHRSIFLAFDEISAPYRWCVTQQSENINKTLTYAFKLSTLCFLLQSLYIMAKAYHNLS